MSSHRRSVTGTLTTPRLSVGGVMSDQPRDRAHRRERRTGKAPSEGSHGARGRTKE